MAANWVTIFTRQNYPLGPKDFRANLTEDLDQDIWLQCLELNLFADPVRLVN